MNNKAGISSRQINNEDDRGCRRESCILFYLGDD